VLFRKKVKKKEKKSKNLFPFSTVTTKTLLLLHHQHMSSRAHPQIALPDDLLLQDILRAEDEIKQLEAEIAQEEAQRAMKVVLPEDPVTDTNLTALLQRLRPSTDTK